MNTTDKIFVAGHLGLVGSAIVRALVNHGFTNIVHRTHRKLDLTEQSAVNAFFADEHPLYVFLAAARVGGIRANDTFRAEFIYQNLMITSNVIHAAYRNDVKKLVYLGSSCMYPRECEQPMQERCILSGPLEPTNEPYAVAKIAGAKLCESYRRQYGMNCITAIPATVYGMNDNFNLDASHVLPALIRRFHDGTCRDLPEIVIWGSGSPLREFLYVDDLAEALLFLMGKYDAEEPINIGGHDEISIRDLVYLVRDIVGFKGSIRFDTSKPDGMHRKLLDMSKLTAYGWKPAISLREGISRTYDWFIKNNDMARL